MATPRRNTSFTDDLGNFTPGYRDKWAGETDWCVELTRTEKALYQQLIEQPGITRAGVVAVGADVLAEQHPDCTPDEIEKDLLVLIEKNYIVRDGSLLWVRSWFKYDRNLANPKYLRPILDAVQHIAKARLRTQVAQSLVDTYVAFHKKGKPMSRDLAQMIHDFAADLKVPSSGLPSPGSMPVKRSTRARSTAPTLPTPTDVKDPWAGS